MTNNADVGELQRDIKTLKSVVSRMQQEIARLAQSNAQMKEQLNSLQYRNNISRK